MKHPHVAKLVKQAYRSSTQDFGKWMWANHVPIVADKTEELSIQFGADQDLAVAGAWLHDFGDAFVHRLASEHEAISAKEATKVLEKAGYSDPEIHEIIHVIIEPHSCKDGNLPQTIEGKVLATADALAHLTTDFYLQFCWKHLPDDKSYPEFLEWVNTKLERDYHHKIFFDQVRKETTPRYHALKEVFANNPPSASNDTAYHF